MWNKLSHSYIGVRKRDFSGCVFTFILFVFFNEDFFFDCMAERLR